MTERAVPHHIPFVAAVACAAAGCAGPQSALDPRGPAAESIAGLSWILITLAAVVCAVVIGLILLLPRRGQTESALDEQRILHWVLWAGGGIPALIISALFIYSIVLLGALSPERRNAQLTIELTGQQWWWQVVYLQAGSNRAVFSANEIHIPTGQPVHLRLSSADVIHSFWVPALQGKTDLIPGRTNVMWLQADEPGRYRAQCAEYCGLQHARMALYVVAHPPAEFTSWLDQQARESTATTHPGLAVFMGRGCAACHTVRGTAARGTFGPDLTHLATRLTLAAGTVPNTPGNLAAWMANPQAIKPGNLMPRIPLPADELQLLLSFLQSLQ